MIKLYKVTKSKSKIKGLWHDNTAGKVYFDNVTIQAINSDTELKEGIKSLFTSGELAVFYSIDKSGYCIDNQGNITRYNYRLRLHRQKLSIKEIKNLLRVFSGLTIYKINKRYIIEVYHN